MVEYDAASLNRTFRALGDPTRRSVLAHLARGDATVTELADLFPISLAAVSKHLRVLERAGLVHRRIEGRTHFLSLETEAMEAAMIWLSSHRRFWEESLDAIQDHLEGDEETSP